VVSKNISICCLVVYELRFVCRLIFTCTDTAYRWCRAYTYSADLMSIFEVKRELENYFGSPCKTNTARYLYSIYAISICVQLEGVC
jgi:hypothetical protein